MVLTLQRLLEATETNGYKDGQFYVHLALAKQFPQSNHIDLALKQVPVGLKPDELVSFIFEYTVCPYEKILPFVTACETKKYRARAYCMLARPCCIINHRATEFTEMVEIGRRVR